MAQRNYLAEALARSKWAKTAIPLPTGAEEEALSVFFFTAGMLKVQTHNLMHAVRSYIDGRFD